MALYELDRFREGLFFCLFDTPDRLQHMLWRFRDRTHPANGGTPPTELAHGVEDHYAECDAIVGRVLERADADTLVVVLSDHGFGSFRRGVNLNTWLHDAGWLVLKDGVRPGEEAGEFLRAVDWGRTRAYALGIGSIYLNVAGREGDGIVAAADAPRVAHELAQALRGLCDPATGLAAVRAARTREEIYTGAYAAESPDVLVGFAEGYRASWATALGGVPAEVVEDNTRRWSGDHIIDPALVPGVLFMNRPFASERAALTDMAPTILSALGVPKGGSMEGESLFS
jgi:predicted AlkP superfamily phosphohydrolase/phosphomutase